MKILFLGMAGSDVNLHVILPQGVEGETITANLETATGKLLKEQLAEVATVSPDEQILYYQNQTRNAAKVRLVDDTPLATQGVEADAIITIKTLETDVAKEDSELRQSIQRSGTNSYYYAHANEKELPLEHRYVYGGAPAKLEGVAEDFKAEVPIQSIEKYAWSDEGDSVKIYISADNEADAIEAMKGGEVTVEFESHAVDVTICGKKNYVLKLFVLESEILPDQSKHRVSAGKRLTITLKKKNKNVTWTRLLRPNK